MLFRFDEIREATGGTFLNPPRGEGVDSITTDSRLARAELALSRHRR